MGWLCLELGVLALENACLPPQTRSLTAWHPEDLSAGPWGPAASPEMPEASDYRNPNALPGFPCSFHSNSPKPVATMLKNPTSQDLFVPLCVQRYPGVWVGLDGSLCSPVQGQLSSDPPVFSGRLLGRCRGQGPGSPIRTSTHGSEPSPQPDTALLLPAEALVSYLGTLCYKENARDAVMRDLAFLTLVHCDRLRVLWGPGCWGSGLEARPVVWGRTCVGVHVGSAHSCLPRPP